MDSIIDSIHTAIENLSPSEMISTTLGLTAAAAGSAYVYYSNKSSLTPELKYTLEHQSVEYPPGSGVYRNRLYKDSLVECMYDGCTTLYSCFQRGATLNPDRPCIGWRPKIKGPDGKETAGPFQWQTYSEISVRISNFASGLRSLGVETHKPVGFYMINRPEWAIGAEAVNSQSMISVAAYDTLGPESVEYVVQHSEMVALIATADKVSKIIPFINRVPLMHTLIVVGGDATAEQKQRFSEAGKRILTFEEVEQIGAQQPMPPTPPVPDDLAVIMYTSGTTGTPKGVLITHRNLVSAAAGVILNIFELKNTDRFLSFLPLAHSLARACENALFMHGAAIGYFQGEATKILDDVQALKPTLFVAVPRLYERVYTGIKDKVKKGSPLQQKMFQMAYEAKRKAIKEGTRTPIWDKLVFNKFKTAMGGEVRGMLSGSAPLRAEVHEFLMTCFDVPFVIGYGLTETCCAGTAQVWYDHSIGHIGCVNPAIELKVVDIPDMNYFSRNLEGEICIRGPSVTPGYYKDQEKTDEVYDKDGWFHTGDVGRINPDGTVSLIDRKKNIFKLSQGEYIAAEKVEAVFAACPLVSQLCVYGDSTKSFLVCIIVPEPKKIKDLAAQLGVPSDDLSQICRNPLVVKSVLAEFEKLGKAGKLSSLEIPKAIHLAHDPFTVENGLITPTLKVKRPELKKAYQAEIDRMYAETK